MPILLSIALGVSVSSCASIAGEDVTTLNWDGYQCVQMIEDHERAIEHCNRAIESTELTQHGLAETFTNRGWHFSRLGQVENALADYSQAIEIGEVSTAYYNRGAMYERLGDRARARADFLKAYEMAPELKSHQEKAREYGLIE